MNAIETKASPDLLEAVLTGGVVNTENVCPLCGCRLKLARHTTCKPCVRVVSRIRRNIESGEPCAGWGGLVLMLRAVLCILAWKNRNEAIGVTP